MKPMIEYIFMQGIKSLLVVQGVEICHGNVVLSSLIKQGLSARGGDISLLSG